MLPSGPPTPIGAGQSVSSSHLRSNSGMLGGQGGPGPGSSQNAFTSVVPQRAQFNNVNMLGNILSASSQLSQSLGNGPNGAFGPGSTQRGGMDTGAESDPLSNVGNGMAFSAPPQSSFGSSDMTMAGMSSQAQGQQFSSQSMHDQPQSRHLEQQSFQQSQQPIQQFPTPHNTQQQLPQQQQFQSFCGGSSGVGSVKLEPQMVNDQLGPQQQQQIQSQRNFSQVKLEPQQVPAIRNLSAVKMEPQHTNPPPYLQQQQQQQHQQQQQQQLMFMLRQSSQAPGAHITRMHQQRMLQLQQPQAMKLTSQQQRAQFLQQLQQQNVPLRSPLNSACEPGTGARRLTDYMYQQQRRPVDNNIEFWRKFVAEFFAPHAKKRWCVSLYGSGRQAPGVIPQDVWHCDICDRKPGRGFEATVEVLPRLFKIKYDSGTLEELLYIDMPREYQNPSGQIVLDYAKAIQESVFEHLRVVRDGQLRIVFSRDLKICSWEFCARHHEELIPRKLLMPQVSQLGFAAQKYQAATQNASASPSVPELQNNCNMFLSSARQLAKALEVPLVNELGYTKRYIRCLQIAEVVNSMKDLIDYSRETGTGPMDSLAKFPRRMTSSGFQNKAQESEEQPQQQQQTNTQSASSELNPMQAAAAQLASSNGASSVNNSVNAASTSTPANSVVGLLHQNSMNSRQQVSGNNASSPYGGSNVQIQSPGSSNTMPQAQPNASPFHSPTPSSSNAQNPHNSLPSVNHINSMNPQSNAHMQQPAISREADPSDSQSSVQKMLQDLMSSSLNGAGSMASLGNEMKHPNGILPGINTGQNNASSMMGNGPSNNSINGGAGFGAMAIGLGQSATMNGLRGNSVLMNGRVGVAQMVQAQSMNHQQDMSNQLLNGLGAGNGFNNLQFD